MAYHFIAFDDVSLSVNAEVQVFDDVSNLPTKSTLPTKNSQQTENSLQQAPLQNDNLDDVSATVPDEVDDCCDIDCCDGECFCPANACSSLAFLDNTLGYLKIMLASESMLSLAQASPVHIVTSLYRPPIFTS
ncbi:hypothetical protein L0668_00150 [Paraglaciecola aquimarina]|uniref:Uncharacterized protein n=1 Tax=Paraglaciecola algarum TaxID=3050085 RepID=A0ABS9D3V7_9ALTE|nr:hypothetical protein [Paraglaciecola sp. G1-23]MCF2946509.1 hypothetical protein [Paraglaciecola sp. G1-23]